MEINPEDQVSSPIRRRLFKLTGTAVKYGAFSAAASITGKKILNEAAVAFSGSFENDGINYFPIYEAHSSQKGTVPLPQETSGLYMEYNIPSWTYKGKNYNLYNLPVEELVRIISERPVDKSYLNTARQKLFPIAFGDIVTFEEEGMSLIKIASEEDYKNFWQGIYVIVGSYIPEATRQALSQKIPELSRRQFLTLTLAGAGTFLGSWINTKTKAFENETLVKAVQTNPFNRFLLRLYGLSTTFHPEEPFIFVRNIIQTLKIKGLGNYLKQNNVHPTVCFDTGAIHGGTEDFIPLPDDLLRLMVAYADNSYMGHVVRKYGDSVASTRLIIANKSGTFQDLPPLVDQNLLSLLEGIPQAPESAQIKQYSDFSNR